MANFKRANNKEANYKTKRSSSYWKHRGEIRNSEKQNETQQDTAEQTSRGVNEGNERTNEERNEGPNHSLGVLKWPECCFQTDNGRDGTRQGQNPSL